VFLELGGRELARHQPADGVRGQEPKPQNRTLRHGSAGDEILPASGSILKQCVNNMAKELERQMHFVNNAIKSHRRKSKKSFFFPVEIVNIYWGFYRPNLS
jgi:hypothetical protein